MITAVKWLLVGSVLLSLVFIAVLGSPRKHEDRTMAWFLACTGWAGLLIDVALFAVMLGASIPVWVFVVLLGLQDLVFGWRLLLVVQARRRTADEGSRT